MSIVHYNSLTFQTGTVPNKDNATILLGLSDHWDVFYNTHPWERYFSTKSNTTLPFVLLQPRDPIYSNPTPPPPPGLTWIQRFELTNANSQHDWPNPRAYPPIDQFWSQSLNIFFQSETFPFSQKNYPNPQPVVWYQSWTNNNLQNTLRPTGQNPFFQTDWPLPRTNQPIDQFWFNSTNNLPIQGPNVLCEYLWQIPNPITWYQDWNQNLQQTTLAPSAHNPFFQTDWPIYRTYQPIDQFYAYNQIKFILQQPASYFQQYDWPNPPRVVWDRFWSNGLVPGVLQGPFNQTNWPNPPPLSWYQEWHQALAPYLPNLFPFVQTDWPNPKTWTPIDQWWFNVLTNLPAVNTAKPFNQTDWPLPRDYQRIDETFVQSIINLFPPPPPPPPILSSGRQLTEREVLSAWMRAIRAKGH